MLDGEKKKEVQKSQTEMQKQEEEEAEAELAAKQKGGKGTSKRVMPVKDLEEVFTVLLRSVEMINYNRGHALVQMHNLSNFID